MVANRVREWLGILAAVVHLALFLAAVYGLCMFLTGTPFLASFLSALPIAFGACALFFACAAGLEACHSMAKRAREAAKQPQYVAHH